jgi:hypothetical protein
MIEEGYWYRNRYFWSRPSVSLPELARSGDHAVPGEGGLCLSILRTAVSG